MKRIGTMIIVALASLAVLVTPVAADTSLPCPICDTAATSSYVGALTESEVEGLLLALNDEYHAWAVYDQVLVDFDDVRPFSRIIKSEERHIEALVDLFDTYGLSVPANPWIGEVPSFASVQEAAQAGVDAEVANAELYDQLFASTDREDIERVYTSLQRASLENHLPAFERAASRESTTRQAAGRGRAPMAARGRASQ